jgi:hypothetical protein
MFFFFCTAATTLLYSQLYAALAPYQPSEIRLIAQRVRHRYIYLFITLYLVNKFSD